MKLYRNIIIIVVVLGILISGLILVNKLSNEKPEETKKGKEPAVVTETEPVQVLELEAETIAKIEVKTEDEKYTLTKIGDSFKISNSNNIKIDDFAVQSAAASYSEISASQLVSEKAEDAVLYGFDKPKGSVTLSLNDGTNKTIQIGKDYVDGNGSYIKLADENKIYGMTKQELEMIAPAYTVFVSTNIFSLDPSYTTLSYFEIAKSGNTPYRFEYVVEEKDDTTLTAWKMTKPIKAEANVSVLSEKVLTPFETFGASGVADAHPDNLSVYGLDKPYATLKIASSAVSHKFVFGKEVDGYRYFKADNYASVYMIKSEDVAFIDATYIDLIERNVHIEDIKDISKVEIKGPDVEYVMEISDSVKKINGKEIGKSFSKAYEAVIGMKFNSVNTSFKGGTPEATIKFTRTDGTKCTLTYVPVNEVNYHVRIDGSGYAVISKSTFNEAMNVIKKIYNED